MDAELLEQLLYEDESTTLDFKKEQYKFAKATDHQKSELLKDILGFVNAWRRSDAYILIGVEEVRGGRSNIVGITDHLNDHSLQQFVNNLANRPVQFSYEACQADGKQIGIIRIDLQVRPVYLKRNYGKLEREKVYVRRGSSTDPTKPASPEEIAQMGVALHPACQQAELAIEFAEVGRDGSLGTSIPWSAERCDMPGMKEIPKLCRPRYTNPFGIDFSAMESIASHGILNEFFYHELANYEFVKRLCRSVRLVVTNKGKVAAHNVRVELIIPKGQRIGVSDTSEIPEPPKKQKSRLDIPALKKIRPVMPRVGNVDIDANDDRFKLEIECGNLQPGRKVWSEVFVIGIAETGKYVLNGHSYAENLSEPSAFQLVIDANITKSQMTLDELLALSQPDQDNDEFEDDDDD